MKPNHMNKLCMDHIEEVQKNKHKNIKSPIITDCLVSLKLGEMSYLFTKSQIEELKQCSNIEFDYKEITNNGKFHSYAVFRKDRYDV